MIGDSIPICLDLTRRTAPELQPEARPP